MSNILASPGMTKTGIPVRNLWYMLLYVWDAVHLLGRWKSDEELAPTLDALLGSILGHLLQQRFRIGLGRDYRMHEGEVSGLRGQVDFNQSLKRMSLQHGRTYCRYQVYCANVPKNQIIRSTLARLVQIGEFGPVSKETKDLRHRLRSLVRNMETANFLELTADTIRREQLKRHDLDYVVMLAICNLLFQRQMPTQITGQRLLPGIDQDGLTLHNIYERFVAKFYAHHLEGWVVSPHQKMIWPTEQGSVFLPAMYPDLVLFHENTKRRVVLDTKFTTKSLVATRWGKLIFNRNHLFQIYAYLKSQEHLSDSHQTSTGILLYPTVNHELSETISVQGHKICWETVDLARPWQEIQDRLLAIADGV